jgi:hypothetical protein
VALVLHAALGEALPGRARAVDVRKKLSLLRFAHKVFDQIQPWNTQRFRIRMGTTRLLRRSGRRLRERAGAM